MIFDKLKTLMEMILVYKNWHELFLARYGFLGKGISECKTRDGIKLKFRKATNDHSIMNDIFVRKSYEKYVEPKGGFTVIDIGANIGAFSIYAASKGARVFSYEPEEENFKLLNKNVNLNLVKIKVHTFKIAVSGKRGYATLFISKKDVGGHSIVSPDTEDTEKQKVRTITLSDVFESNKIEKCDFLKLDCEGAEYDILLKTSKGVLNKIKNIAMEFHMVKSHDYKGLVRFLVKNGFKVEYTKPSNVGIGLIYGTKI